MSGPRRSPATRLACLIRRNPPICRRIDRVLEGEEPADPPVQAPAPERRMRWSFRIFREEYLRGSYVCQVEPLSKSSVLRVPETPPGSNLHYVPHAGGVSFWRMTRRSPRSPGRVLRRGLGLFGLCSAPADEHLPPSTGALIAAVVLA